MPKIMLIRHAEKHSHGSHDRGVTADGHPSCHELTVRGWQRATALVSLFGPPGAVHRSPAIQTPRSIFASDATKESPSVRAIHTAAPLAAALGLPIHHEYEEGEEAALAEVVVAAPSPVLIVWHHGVIPKLARKIAGKHLGCPADWPEERFDMVWILDCSDARAGNWSFSQVAQRLLPDDRPDLF